MRKFRHDISIIPPKDVRFSGKSLSEYELILALIEKVNELIKYTNSVAELVYALEKWINDEFINAIDESTKKTLIEWRESGYLQELVEDYLVNLTVATSELLDEEEQKFEKSWHPVLDTKLSFDKVPKEVFEKEYSKNYLINGDFKGNIGDKNPMNWGWHTHDTTPDISELVQSPFGDGLAMHIKTDNARYYLTQIGNYLEVKEGDTVTVSADVLGDGLEVWVVFYDDNMEMLRRLNRVEFEYESDVRKYVRFVVEEGEKYFELARIGVGVSTNKTGEVIFSNVHCAVGENIKFYPNWQDLTEEEKPYTVMTLEKGVSDDLFLISKIQESNLQKHDSMVRLRNVGQPFIIKDGVSGKYVEVPKKQSLDPNVDGIPFNEYNLRNVFANITFSLHPDNTDDKIMVALDKSSIMHKVNIDEGFIWLVSRMDKLEDDMVIFEKWVKDYVTTKITELENNFSTQLEQIGLNVKTYGAKGDGLTDDTDAIQSAIDYVANNSGGTVYLPTGVYRIEGILELDNNIRLVGDGISTVIDGVKGSNNATIYPKYRGGRETYNGASNFSIENIAFNTSDRSRQGLYFDNCVNYKVINFWGLNTADHYLDVNNSFNGYFENIYLNDNVESNSLFQIDSREGKNDGLVLKNLHVVRKEASIKDSNPNQSVIHFHREGGRNILIDGVKIYGSTHFIGKDPSYVMENVVVKNVYIEDVWQPFLLRMNEGMLSKNITFSDVVIVHNELANRGIGHFASIENLVFENISVKVDSVNREQLIRIFGCNRVSVGKIDITGDYYVRNPEDPLYFLEIDQSKKVIFTSPITGNFELEVIGDGGSEPVVLSRNDCRYTILGERVEIDARVTVQDFKNHTGVIYFRGLPVQMQVSVNGQPYRPTGMVSMTSSLTTKEHLPLGCVGYPGGSSGNDLITFSMNTEDKRLTIEYIESNQKPDSSSLFFVMFNFSYFMQIST